MSIFKENDERVVIPLWNKSTDAAYSPELRSLNPKIISFEISESTKFLYQEFLNKKEVGVAVDLLNTAVIEGMEKEAVVAADFILSGFELPQQIITLAKKTKGIIDNVVFEEDTLRNKISKLRRWLRDNPRDCLGWVDLSRHYTSLGDKASARKCMVIGMGLADKHRWVTRVATRFFYNIEEYDIAHHILLKHPNINSDPWLISAELAVSSGYGRPTKLWGQARRVLESGIKQYHISELQSSVGTIELMNGTAKKAKKLFVNSLLIPNSNVLAQAKWVERSSDIKGLVDQNILKEQKGAFEAKCWEAYASQDMVGALGFCKKWIEEEPYTLEPIIFASYLASLLDNYQESLDISEQGLSIDPHNETLQLNMIFSQISLAEIKGDFISKDMVSNAISRISPLIKHEEKSVVAHACANLGLIFYKTGNINDGREWYEKAIDIFRANKHPSLVLAELNHLRESLLSRSPWANEQFEEMESKVKSGGIWNDPSAHYYLKKLNAVKNDLEHWREHLLDNPLPSKSEGFENSKPKEKNNVKFDFDPKNPTIWILPRNGK